MKQFTIGDAVVTKQSEEWDSKFCVWPIGSSGIVRCLADNMVGIVFDTPNEHGHSLNGECNYGFGYYVFPEELQLVDCTPDEAMDEISVDDLKLLFGW